MKIDKAIDLTEILKPYVEKNLWVALNDDQTEVIGSGKTIKEAISNARKNSKENPVLIRADKDYSAYIPIIQV